MKRYLFEVRRWGTSEVLALVFTETTSKRKAQAACRAELHICESLGPLLSVTELA